jgi:tetraacyldisaccharide-1-P 4'-kinase
MPSPTMLVPMGTCSRRVRRAGPALYLVRRATDARTSGDEVMLVAWWRQAQVQVQVQAQAQAQVKVQVQGLVQVRGQPGAVLCALHFFDAPQ